MTYKLSPSLLFAFLINFTQIALCKVQNDFVGGKLSSEPLSRIKTEYLEKRGLKIDDKEYDNPQQFYQQHKVVIISVCSFLAFLIICYLIALFRHRKGNNSIIFSMTLIFLDFVFDILFILVTLKNGKDVPWLFKPSLIVLIGPVCLNCTLSFGIMIYERINNEEFAEWFKKYTQFAAIVTVFAGADIEALKLIYSELAGCQIFESGISDKAKKWLLWGSVINILFEDLPQFVIQILYKENTDNDYTLIPFLTLVTSTIVLLVDIVGRIYDALNKTVPTDPQGVRDEEVHALNKHSRETTANTASTIYQYPDLGTRY